VVFLVGVAVGFGLRGLILRPSQPSPKVPSRSHAVYPKVHPSPTVSVPKPQKPGVGMESQTFAFPPGNGKIALVLDDWGYNLYNVSALERIRAPLTLAILPHLPYSDDVARLAKAHGHEVILHMPMQAVSDSASQEPSTVLVGMPKERVSHLVDEALRTVPEAVGISNHQGSKATADRTSMTFVLTESKRRGLYFLDSYVTPHSVARKVADRLKVPFARRDVFLDNDPDPAAIRQRLLELVRLANRKGYAVGIGHDRPLTLSIIEQAIPDLQRAGYTLVPVSQLIEVDSNTSSE